MKLEVMVDKDVEIPAYAHAGDAGLDLRVREGVWLHPQERRKVGTGVRVAIPEGYVGLVFPRSGFSSNTGVSLSNCTGVIDATFRGEIQVPLINHDKKPHLIKAGERVCQLVVVPCASCELVVVDELDETERGENGFGSTGLA